jgi:biopolymer transport protein ExbD
MSRRHKKHKKQEEELKLNVTAMLDMAFQLLAFFVLTFKPAPVEGQIQLKLPPPVPVTATAGQSAGQDDKNTDPLKGLNTLAIHAQARPDGTLEKAYLYEASTADIRPGGTFEKWVHDKLAEPGTPFDQVVINVDSRLNYDELMKIVEICTRAKLPGGERLTKLSFSEMKTQ